MAKRKSQKSVEPVKRIRQVIERERKKADRRGRNFTAPTDEELLRKLGKVNSPIIVYQAWTDTAGGGAVSYDMGVHNPDSFSWVNLYVHVFVGPANPVNAIGAALQCVDERFPRLTQPDFFGLSVSPGVTENVHFDLSVPAGIEPSEYLGNSFVFQVDYHDVGTYFDRGCFPFTVS
jgi:hypothetical protein